MVFRGSLQNPNYMQVFMQAVMAVFVKNGKNLNKTPNLSADFFLHADIKMDIQRHDFNTLSGEVTFSFTFTYFFSS